jgi:hypothetical protein
LNVDHLMINNSASPSSGKPVKSSGAIQTALLKALPFRTDRTSAYHKNSAST